MNAGKFDFIFSNRFWAIVIGATSVYLQAKGWIGEPEMMFIASISVLFTTVRTVDRATEVLSSNQEPPVSANQEGD